MNGLVPNTVSSRSPPTLHISLETCCGVEWRGPRSPQLIEIFINISLPDIYQQQKQESERVFQDQNESVHKRDQESVMLSLCARSRLIDQN